MITSMTRRSMLAAMAGAVMVPAQEKRQNVLFIAIDDLNNWIGCLGGHPDVRTPNLDRVAARGTLFTNAHCAAPLCNPSRAALMTGLRPSTTGVYDNNQPWRQAPLLARQVTLPQHFAASGYSVSGSGKTYHDAFPDPPSWQEYYPALNRQKPPDPLPPDPPLNGIPRTAHFDWGPINNADAEMGDYKVVDWVSAQLARRHQQPFFLACGLYKPHLPWYIPKKYFDQYPLDRITLPKVKDDDLDDVPPIGRDMALRSGDHAKVLKHNQWRKAVQSYLAAISFADAQVGRVLDALDASPHKANTNIVLWSDHGWQLGEKLHWRKFALWERSTRNVLMIAAPGVTKPGSRCHRTVSLLDIYPTLVDLCGLPKRSELEGRSLMPLLKDPRTPWDRPAVTTYGQNNHAVRDERYRYIRYRDGTEELYDHNDDPNEWTNIAARPGMEKVKASLARHLPSVNAEPSPTVRGAGE